MIVDITANHQGYFIFKLCPNNDIFQDPGQNCFDQRPLWVGGGDPVFNQTRYPINDYETGLRMVYVRLPMDVICEQCILQWTYVAGKKNFFVGTYFNKRQVEFSNSLACNMQ